MEDVIIRDDLYQDVDKKKALLLFYLCSMSPDDDNLQQRWLQLQQQLTERLGITPDINSVLLMIGIRESGRPAKKFTEKEINDLRQMALSTILAPARYYELMWVDDTGWPHFRQLQRVPEMNEEERETFLKPFVLKYTDKNKFL